MSVRIVKRGTPPKEKVWAGTCLRCNSLLEARAEDLTYESSYRNEDSYQTECPVCGFAVYFTETDRVWKEREDVK